MFALGIYFLQYETPPFRIHVFRTRRLIHTPSLSWFQNLNCKIRSFEARKEEGLSLLYRNFLFKGQQSVNIKKSCQFLLTDFGEISRRCQEEELDGNNLIVEQVNICNSVLVRGLTERTTKESLWYYFENPRNGGGEIVDIEHDTPAGTAVVHYEDPAGLSIMQLIQLS